MMRRLVHLTSLEETGGQHFLQLVQKYYIKNKMFFSSNVLASRLGGVPKKVDG